MMPALWNNPQSMTVPSLNFEWQPNPVRPPISYEQWLMLPWNDASLHTMDVSPCPDDWPSGPYSTEDWRWLRNLHRRGRRALESIRPISTEVSAVNESNDYTPARIDPPSVWNTGDSIGLVSDDVASYTVIVAPVPGRTDRYTATGTSKRDPHDVPNREIGVKLAAARAYRDLARQLEKETRRLIHEADEARRQDPKERARRARRKAARPSLSPQQVAARRKAAAKRLATKGT